MRELKFRVWNKGLKKWDNPYYLAIKLQYEEGNPNVLSSSGIFSPFSDSHYEYEIQQFTGLKDESGEEIYEGDILYASYHGLKAEVIYDNNYCLFRLAAGNSLSFYVERGSFFEIMGNIFENSESLK